MGRSGLLGLLISMVAASSVVAADAEPPLVGTVWRWRGLSGPDPVEVASPGRYTLELLAEGRYAVRADCNRGGGSYTLEGDHLALHPGPMTAAECGPASHFDRFLRALSEVEGFVQDGDRMALQLAGDAGSMELEARREVALAGTAWLVRAYNDQKQAVVSVLRDTSLDASFGPDGRLTGSAGCNRFSADYAFDGKGIEIGPVAATRMACSEPEGVMAQESAFLTALGTPSSWRIEGERLQLRTDDGALAVDLVAAVTGSVSYRVRRALPQDAEIRVRLEDVSLADAPALLLGEQVFRAEGRQVPLPFEVVYDPADIEPRHSYGVNARITDADGRLLFVTATAHHVITRDHPSLDVEIELEPVR